MIKNQQPCPIVDENERSLRFEYRFRRYGIIVLSLIILTALSGLWSSGYFSEAHRETSGGELSVDYQRYARLMSETELNIQIKPDTASDTIISFAAPLLTLFSMVRRLSWWKMVLSSTRRLSSSISLSMISCWRPGSTMAFMN